jgi:putative ABC transport system permease protein
MFKNYFITAWRNINNQKLYSLINIGSLSVAMTAVILIMIWVQNELRFDSFHHDANNIYLVKTYEQADKNDVFISENSPYALSAAMNEFPEVSLVTQSQRTQKNELTLKVNDKLFTEEWGLYIDKNWFKVFNYQFIEGNAQSFFAHPYSLILTESKAKKLFGKTEVVGSRVQIDSAEYMVQGVIKDNPLNSSFQFDLLLPLTAKLNTKAELDEANYWGNLGFKTFVKLRNGTDTAKTSTKINTLFKSSKHHQYSLKASLMPLTSIHFDNDFQWSAFKHGNIKTVKIFTLLAILLLLTASVNYVNLSVARAGVRSKEISVRKIVGANRPQLFLQMTAESVLTSLLALIFTMLLVTVCIPFFNGFTGMKFMFNPFEPYLALVLFGTLLIVILLTGIYPALLLSSFNPVNPLKGIGFFKIKDMILRKALVVGQFALAVIMTVAATTVYKQLMFIQQQDTRYNRAQVFSIQIPSNEIFKIDREKWEGFLQPIKHDLLTKSQVQNVSVLNVPSVINLNYETAGNLDWDGKDPEYNPKYIDFSADADLNQIMKFRFAEGHWFDKKNISDTKNTILNETAVKQFGLKEPVAGMRFKDGIVIGVVKDFYYKSMHEKIGPVVIRLEPSSISSFMVEAQPGKAAEALHEAETIWHKYFPNATFVYTFLDEEFNTLYRDDQRALSFTLVFSALSILISCIGLLGMTVFAAERRRKEIGIRKVMGASAADIAGLLSADFVKLVFIAILIAFPIAWWSINRWLQDYAYRIEIQWWMFASAAAMVVLVAILTISFQAIKAAMANPVKSLRTE